MGLVQEFESLSLLCHLDHSLVVFGNLVFDVDLRENLRPLLDLSLGQLGHDLDVTDVVREDLGLDLPHLLLPHQFEGKWVVVPVGHDVPISNVIQQRISFRFLKLVPLSDVRIDLGIASDVEDLWWVSG